MNTFVLGAGMSHLISGHTQNSIKDIWGERTPTVNQQWPVRVDSHVQEEPERWVQSACLLCSNGCGLDIGVRDGRMVGVRGREDDRVNHGRLGPKGLHGVDRQLIALIG